MGKKGQLKISFGMIFSIILIVVFIAFAGYAIVKFINLQQTIQIESFKNDLQNDVNALSGGDSYQREYYLPKKINEVCFDGEGRLYFEVKGILDETTIDNVNVVEDICFDNVGGKVRMTLAKDYDEIKVRIE